MASTRRPAPGFSLTTNYSFIRWPSLEPTHPLFEGRPRDRRVLVFLLPWPSSPPLLGSVFLGHFFYHPFTFLSLMTSFVSFISHTQFLISLRQISTTYSCRQTDSPESFFFLNPIDFYPSIRIAGGAQRIYCPPISAFDLIF